MNKSDTYNRPIGTDIIKSYVGLRLLPPGGWEYSRRYGNIEIESRLISICVRNSSPIPIKQGCDISSHPVNFDNNIYIFTITEKYKRRGL